MELPALKVGKPRPTPVVRGGITIFLSSIFGIFDFLKISRLFLVIGLFLFLTGFAYYLIASCDLIKMVKILYSVDEGKKQQTIADFEKELRK